MLGIKDTLSLRLCSMDGAQRHENIRILWHNRLEASLVPDGVMASLFLVVSLTISGIHYNLEMEGTPVRGFCLVGSGRIHL